MKSYASILSALYLGIYPKTLRRWDAARLVRPAFRTPGGHRRYDLAALKALRRPTAPALPTPPHPAMPVRAITYARVAITYARVSSSLQKKRGDLQRQIEELH
ncbi:MAG: MerR family DNA-binding transcriptional regulator [Candidatus Helarchaeota archaeon]